MKTLYWHIGWRKTGTSALQHFIESTMDDAGMLGDIQVIPIGVINQKHVTEHTPFAHHGLTYVGARGGFNRAWAEVRQYVTSSPAEKFLITSEAFSARFATSPDIFRLLRNRMTVFDRIIVLFWVRPADEYAASLEVQGAKAGAVGRGKGQPLPELGDARYMGILNKLGSAIPTVELRGHLHGGDIVQDLVKSLDLDQSLIGSYESIPVNETVSAEMYRLQIEVNKWARKHEADPRALQATLIKSWNRLPKEGMTKAVCVTLEDRVEITERNRQSSVNLCRRFGFPKEQMVPSRDQLSGRPQYNIPERVPADFARAIIDNIHGDDDTEAMLETLRKAVNATIG